MPSEPTHLSADRGGRLRKSNGLTRAISEARRSLAASSIAAWRGDRAPEKPVFAGRRVQLRESVRSAAVITSEADVCRPPTEPLQRSQPHSRVAIMSTMSQLASLCPRHARRTRARRASEEFKQLSHLCPDSSSATARFSFESGEDDVGPVRSRVRQLPRHDLLQGRLPARERADPLALADRTSVRQAKRPGDMAMSAAICTCARRVDAVMHIWYDHASCARL